MNNSDIGYLLAYFTVSTGLQMFLHQAIFTHRFHPIVKSQNTFGVIICASSCVVFANRAPVSSSPLVVQIIQILQSSGAGCCKERAGGNGLRV